VVCFDDSDLAAWLRPQLTSIALPHFELGRRAVELLLTQDAPAGPLPLPMPLRERCSVAAPAVRAGVAAGGRPPEVGAGTTR